MAGCSRIVGTMGQYRRRPLTGDLRGTGPWSLASAGEPYPAGSKEHGDVGDQQQEVRKVRIPVLTVLVEVPDCDRPVRQTG
jgi:hypothetical protein